MRCIEIKSHGGPEELNETTCPTPPIGADDMLLAIDAAGVNRPDVLQRMGFYPPPPGVTDIPGLEAAGTVVQAPSHSQWKPGDRVMALLPGGGYAAQAVVDHRHVLPIPDDMTAVEAAGVPETLLTVWANVFEQGALQPGETLLVHGATSGIGTMAASLAKAFGARVFGTAGTDEKCEAALGLGFDACVNYTAADWNAPFKQDGGVDVVLDMVGGDTLAANIDVLNPRGRHVSIAFLGGMIGNVNILTVMQKNLVLTGSTLRARSADEKARLIQEVAHHVVPKMASGAVRPVIDQTFPLAQAADAHRRMEARQHIGKIILTL